MRDDRAGSWTGHKPEGRGWCRGHGRALPIALMAHGPAQPAFYAVKDHLPSATVTWALLQQTSVIKCFRDFSTWWFYTETFSKKIPSSHMTLAGIKLTWKLSRETFIIIASKNTYWNKCNKVSEISLKVMLLIPLNFICYYYLNNVAYFKYQY